MGGYTTITGAELARVLCADGWAPVNTEGGAVSVVLWKDAGNHKPIAISLAFPIGRGRVEKICRRAGISAARFDELFVGAEAPAWLSAAPDAEAAPPPAEDL